MTIKIKKNLELHFKLDKDFLINLILISYWLFYIIYIITYLILYLTINIFNFELKIQFYLRKNMLILIQNSVTEFYTKLYYFYFDLHINIVIVIVIV